MASPEAVAREHLRQRELRRAQTDPWHLAGKLGYHYNPHTGQGVFRGKGLTERLHKPLLLHFIQANDDWPFLWMEMSRFSHKSTIWVVEMIRDILNDVNVQLGYFHAVTSKADEVVREALDGLHRFQAGTPPVDDVTAMAIRWRGRPS